MKERGVRFLQSFSAGQGKFHCVPSSDPSSRAMSCINSSGVDRHDFVFFDDANAITFSALGVSRMKFSFQVRTPSPAATAAVAYDALEGVIRQLRSILIL